MPLIKIEFDNQKVKNEEIQALSEAVKKIVSEVTAIEDVFVYANSAQIKVNIAPIEVFVEMTRKLTEKETLMEEIKTKLKDWKSSQNFTQPINLTLIPMDWKFEIGI